MAFGQIMIKKVRHAGFVTGATVLVIVKLVPGVLAVTVYNPAPIVPHVTPS